jgi:hypothetical protein
MQAGEFGLDDFVEALAVARFDRLAPPACYARCSLLAAHARPDQVADDFAQLGAIAQPEGIGLAERLADGGIARG